MSTTSLKTPLKIDAALTLGVAKLRITHEDLTDEDTSQTLDWDDLVVDGDQHLRESTVPANAVILFQWQNLLEEFSGGSVSACTLSVGDGGSATELTNALDVFTGAGTGLKAGNGSYTKGAAIEADYDGKVTIATVDGNLADLDAGEVEVFIYYAALPTGALLA